MKRFSFTAIAASLFCLATPGMARPLDLQTAINEAMQHNPGVQALEHKAASASQQAKSAFRHHFGELSGVATYSFLNDAQVLRPISKQLMSGGIGGMPFERNQFHYGVVYKLPLYLGGKLYSGVRIARLEAQKARALVEGTRWTIRFNVTSLFTAAQALDSVITALKQQIRALDTTRQRLDMMVKDGKRPDIDRLKVVESLEQVKAELAEVRARRTRVGAMLMALMGRDPDRDIQVAPQREHVPAIKADKKTLHALLEDISQVRRARLAFRQANRATALVLSEFIPHFSAFADWMQHYGPDTNDPMNTWGIGIRMDLPILSGGSRFADLAAARQKRYAAMSALKRAHLQARARLKDAVAAFKAAKSRLESARARLAAATEAARIEQIRYDTGADTIEDLLRARAREEGAHAEMARTLASIITAAERINMTVEKEVVR